MRMDPLNLKPWMHFREPGSSLYAYSFSPFLIFLLLFFLSFLLSFIFFIYSVVWLSQRSFDFFICLLLFWTLFLKSLPFEL
jgi:hypothetical protein